jgi:hypothetical protein
MVGVAADEADAVARTNMEIVNPSSAVGKLKTNEVRQL